MKIKKNLVAATAAVLAAGMALAGCGSSNGGSGDVQKTADGKVKITMWHGFSEADGKTLESIVDDFNKSQDKYEIDAQLQPWSTIGETMVTKVTTGDGPDFVTTGADNGQGWSIDGTFQCVSDFYADKNNGTGDYLDNVVKQITFNIDGEEEKCAVPMGYAPTSVWYNTDMWKAAGLTDKDIPTTWDQLLEVAKKLTKSDGSQYGLAMADSGWAAYMKGNGTGLYTTDGKVSINSKENKAFLQKMRDFYNGGYAVPGLDDTAARESFESGQSAMVIVGPWEDQAHRQGHQPRHLRRSGRRRHLQVRRRQDRLQHRLHRPVLVGHLAGRRLREAARHLRVLQVLQQPRQPGEVVPRLRLPAEQQDRHRR